MFIACDISGKSRQERHLTLGTVWIPKQQLPYYEKAVCSFRLQNKMWGELKWTEIKPQKLEEYRKFLTISLRQFSPEIKIILRDKQIEIPKEHFKSEEELLSTFFYVLISNHIKRVLERKSTIKSFDVILDKGEWRRNQTLKLKNFLEYFLGREGFKQTVHHLSQCDSKISSSLQLCDLIIGATSTKLSHHWTNLPRYKQEIIRHIERLLNHRLDEPTLPGTIKFNLWQWRPHPTF